MTTPTLLGRLAVVIALLVPHASVHGQGDPLWRSVDLSRQLHDSLPKRIRVRYGAGTVDVRGAGESLLYAMHLRYDERRAVPVHRFDAEQQSVLLGLESRGPGLGRSGGGRDAGELRLALPRTVPLDLDLEFGGTEATLELGGLTLQSLRLACGATDATLAFISPNRTRLRDLEVNVGAASFAGRQLANANAEQMRFQGGIGSVDLDFGGTWTRDLSVTTRLAVGKLTLRVPSDVGVRLEVRRVAAGFEQQGLVERDGAWYSDNWETAPHKLRILAETFFGQIDLRRATR